MPGASIIFRCPVEGSSPEDRSTASETRFRCNPGTTGAENLGVEITVDTFCADPLNDCSGITGGDTGQPSSPDLLSNEDFLALQPLILVLLTTGFVFRIMRKAISTKI